MTQSGGSATNKQRADVLTSALLARSLARSFCAEFATIVAIPRKMLYRVSGRNLCGARKSIKWLVVMYSLSILIALSVLL